MTRILLFALATVLLPACITQYKDPLISPKTASFPGLIAVGDDGKSKSRLVDVVSVHGMCTHGLDDWVVEKSAELAKSTEGVASEPEKIAEYNGLRLYLTTVTSDKLDVTVNNYSFLWSPMTASAKMALCYDSNKKAGGCVEASYPYKRASLNGKLKSGLVNDCLADALLYTGYLGDDIRAAFRQAIQKIGDLRQDRYLGPLFIITESLGSKVMVDSMQPDPAIKSGLSTSASSLLATDQVFMAANQLPLLGLATEPVEDDPIIAYSLYVNVFLNRQRKAWVDSDEVLRFKDDLINKPSIGMVAFTDPNDLLSYGLPNGIDSIPVNVTISNDKTYFGYVENPLTAHATYLNNNRIWKLIVFGRE